jgi:small-conductance mechanosensitive channel
MLDNLASIFQRYISNPYVPPVVIVTASVFIGFFLRWFTGKWLARLAQNTHNPYDNMLVEALRRSIFYIALLTGINIALNELPRAKVIMPYARPAIMAGFILLLAYIVTKVLKIIVRIRADHEKSPITAVSLTRRAIEIVVYTIAIITALRAFGVEIAPIVTALGIGGLAVALALQDTLSNLFAGIYLTLANQIRVGDYVRTNDGFEGYVRDVGWRNTTIEMLEMNLVLIPNNKISQAIVINYHLPSEVQYIALSCGVDYSTDPQLVEDLVVSIVQECGFPTREEAETELKPETEHKIRGLLFDPPPIVRFREFGEYRLEFRFFVAISHFQFQFEARHRFMKRIYKAFKEAGVIIPVPIRALRIETPSESATRSDISLAERQEILAQTLRPPSA